MADFYGLRYEGNLENGIEFAIFYYGAFEKPLLFFLRDVATVLKENAGSPLCFCDIGSNIGQHSLFMSRFAAQIHAFEPFQAVREKLVQHIALNQLQNITVHPVGLGANDESLRFFAPTGSNQGIGSFVDHGIASDNSNLVDVGKLQVRQADSYFRENNIPLPQLLKIDVEGFERSVLQGMNSILSEARPVLVCEITYGEAQSFSSLDDLRQHLPDDYVVYHFDIRKPNGKISRRRNSKAKRSGAYQLTELRTWRQEGQDDIVAVPREFQERLPLRNSTD